MGQRCCYGAEAALWGVAMGQRRGYGAEAALLWGRGGDAMGQRRRCYGAEEAMLWGRGGAMGRYLEGDDEVDLLPHAPDVGLAEVPREADFGALCGAQRRVGATHGCPTDTRAAHTERTDTPRRPITTPWRPHSAP